MKPVVTAPIGPAPDPVCPGCHRPVTPVRNQSVSLMTTAATDALAECLTVGCSKFGSRWTAADLEAEHSGVVETRPTWDEQFMDIAKITARRATCNRSHVGCVLTTDHRVVSTGYNGSFRNADHCDDVGHHMVKGRCTRTVHAEMNAIADAARRSVSTEGATAYVTREPCVMCMKLLIAAGIVRVVALEVIKPAYLPELKWLTEQIGIQFEFPKVPDIV